MSISATDARVQNAMCFKSYSNPSYKVPWAISQSRLTVKAVKAMLSTYRRYSFTSVTFPLK